VRTITVLLAALALVTGCSVEDRPAAAPSTTTRPATVAPPTTEPVTIDGVRTCGPADGPAVEVDVRGVDARRVELVVVVDDERALVLAPYLATRRSLAADVGLGGAPTAVRIRVPGGPVLAEDEVLEPRYGGACG
jgi:hypothetical protein